MNCDYWWLPKYSVVFDKIPSKLVMFWCVWSRHPERFEQDYIPHTFSFWTLFFFFLFSYFEAMFRSFMPENNTVTVGRITLIFRSPIFGVPQLSKRLKHAKVEEGDGDLYTNLLFVTLDADITFIIITSIVFSSTFYWCLLIASFVFVLFSFEHTRKQLTVFFPHKDYHWWDNSFARSFQLSSSLYLSWRCVNAAWGLTVSFMSYVS